MTTTVEPEDFGGVPVRNVYYLLCYAWQRHEALTALPVGAEYAERPVDLFALLLTDGVARALKRGIAREYVQMEDCLRRPRGKFDVSKTVKEGLLLDAQVACSFDELSPDTPENRILKATLRLLLRDPHLAAAVKQSCRRLVARLAGVADAPFTLRELRRVRIHRHNQDYRFLMSLCELLHRLWIPGGGGPGQFSDIRREPQLLGLLFEEFLRSLWKREQATWRIARETLKWDLDEETSFARMMPSMNTDISLSCGASRAIVECKWTKRPYERDDGSKKLRSTHLYQLFAYLKNAEARGAPYARCTGVLVYPSVGEDVRADLSLQGHRVLVRSVDLGQPWDAIRRQALAVLPRPTSEGAVRTP